MANNGINWNILAIAGAAIGIMYFWNRIKRSGTLEGDAVVNAGDSSYYGDISQRTLRTIIRQEEKTIREEIKNEQPDNVNINGKSSSVYNVLPIRKQTGVNTINDKNIALVLGLSGLGAVTTSAMKTALGYTAVPTINSSKNINNKTTAGRIIQAGINTGRSLFKKR